MNAEVEEYIAKVWAAVDGYIKNPDNPFLQDGIPEFIPLLFKAGYHHGWEAAQDKTEVDL